MKAERNAHSAAVMVRVWLAGIGAWNQRWVSQNGELPVDKTGRLTAAASLWARTLAEFSEAQMIGALERAVLQGAAWPPLLPEMRAMCFGLPSLADVREAFALAPKDRHPFALLVWQKVDGYRYRQASVDFADRLLRDAYEQAREHVMRGGALPTPPTGALKHDEQDVVPASAEVAEANQREIAALLRSSPAVTPRPRREHLSVDAKAKLEAELQQHYAAVPKPEPASEPRA